MTTRPFSVVRRRTNLLDIITPKLVDTQGYRFRGALNFDAAFSDLFTADIGAGFLDANVDRRVLHAVPNGQTHVRSVFDPATFSPTIEDDQHFWLRFQPIDFAGAAGAESQPILILPEEEHKGGGRIIITGDAPVGPDVTASLVIGLPRLSQDFHIHSNEAGGGNPMFVATIENGPERQIDPGETIDLLEGGIDTLLVRSTGAPVSFTADFTNYLPL